MLTTVGICAAIVYGLMVWLHNDGPGRMYAQFVASSDVDTERRQGAIQVLDQTKYLRGHEPGAAIPRWPAARRRSRRGRPVASPANDEVAPA